MKTVLGNVAGETGYVSPKVEVVILQYGNVLIDSADVGGGVDNTSDTINFE